MTMHPFSRRSARPSALRATLLPAHGTACVLLAAWLLTACGSTPLPPWPATPTAPRSAEQPAASRPQARPAPPGPVAVGRAPPAPTGAAAVPRPRPEHPPLGVQGAGPMAAPAVLPSAPPAPPPYGAAVAARFPEPPMAYSTPGLRPERRAFTTNAELGQWLRALADSTAQSAATGTATMATTATTRARVLTIGNS